MTIEAWSVPITNDDLSNMFPTELICEILGLNPNIRTLTDEQIRYSDPECYNMSIATRAYNDNLESELLRYYARYSEHPDFADLMDIHLPQIKWQDSLALRNTILGLHISKLNSQEVFINDIVVRNQNLDSLGHGVTDIIIDNLRSFCRKQGVRYLSGHATNQRVFDLFARRGFVPDQRPHMRNDLLWAVSQEHGFQVPFYQRL